MPPSLVGRATEIAVLTEALARARAGQGGGLLLLGDPGVGKSALLAAAAERAGRTGARVLSCTGTPSERDRPFAALRRLLAPLHDEIGEMPPRARQALLTALGDGEDTGPGVIPQHVGLATLQLLTDAAQWAPLVVTVDDAHWLDLATCRVLAFVARRLADDPVLLIAAARDDDLAGNPLTESQTRVVPVNPLNDRDAAALIDAQAPHLPPLVREHLRGLAEGNPLALIELPLVVRDERDVTATPTLPLTDRLARSFGDRVAGLPPATRVLLLVIAVDDESTAAEALAAAGVLAGGPVTLDDLAPAESAGLIRDTDGRLGFRHPLMRAAVERSADPELRRAAHAALAGTVRDDVRGLWHRAAALPGPDESVAASLERLAERSVRRGTGFAVATALERAAQLSPDPADAVRREVAAIRVAGLGGTRSLTRFITEYADSPLIDPITRCLLRHLHDAMSGERWSGRAGLIEMAEVVLAHGAGHPAEAVHLMESRCTLAWWSDLDTADRALLVRAAESLPLHRDDILRAIILARVAPWERGREALARLERLEPGGGPVELDVVLAETALSLGAAPVAAKILRSAIARLRAVGDVSELPAALVHDAWTCVLLARHPAAIVAAGEAVRLAEESKYPRWVLTALLADAVATARRGGVGAARAAADRAEAALNRAGATSLISMVQVVRGAAGLAAGEPAVAFEALMRMFDPHGGAHNRNSRDWGLTDLMDAAALSGRLDEVRGLHAEMTELAARTGSPLLLASTAASAPLLAPDGEAEAAFEAALAKGLHDWPWQRASLLLHHGRRLRRQRRRADAHGPLREAYDLYESAGAGPWARQAAGELRSSGANVSGLARTMSHTLTSQELQIANLAADGLTNRDIGDRLFLSPRTVRNHLYRIFPKLGISSRSELAGAMHVTRPDSG
ncbi:DNA-binding CsgD family transcriptional regulator [Catenuloplanes nepalensis]|uniref:DNA-binding CsgD family transcriptional regulator n=1 Tax=Catenuloplanes nepalensis TaxID=587533 RepID=A0ABT9MP42_9ACTN|nr:LuxR family transcriptional regulator [Catenuloplanes nepalensis]MDP9793208.1 DNA-binding CsgD family transcriptional regulator [Catenuloplanes nepalensis]